jgi:Protein of unknown function (DUF2917)
MDSTNMSSNEGLAKGRYMTFANGKGVEVRCEQGGVWVTQVNHVRDVCLGAGECFVSDSSDMVLVYAFKPSVVRSTAAAPTSPAARSTLRAREPGSAQHQRPASPRGSFRAPLRVLSR